MLADLREQKKALRQSMLQKREAARNANPASGSALRDQFLSHISLPAGSVVASFCTFGSEIDTQPLTDALRAKGYVIALPVVQGKGQPLLFRRHNAGDPLERAAFGMPEPLPAAPAIVPVILLVPLLAFDRHHYRLGYGGGYYDRTIDQLSRHGKLLTIGIGFACQEVPEIPKGSHDARLDKIATEKEVF